MAEPRGTNVYAIGTWLAILLAILYVAFLLITAFAKPVYTPGAHLATVCIGLLIPTLVAAAMLIVEHRRKEAE